MRPDLCLETWIVDCRPVTPTDTLLLVPQVAFYRCRTGITVVASYHPKITVRGSWIPCNSYRDGSSPSKNHRSLRRQLVTVQYFCDGMLPSKLSYLLLWLLVYRRKYEKSLPQKALKNMENSGSSPEEHEVEETWALLPGAQQSPMLGPFFGY